MTKARDVSSRSGMTQIIPTSVTVGSGSGSVSANGAVTFSGASTVAIDNCFTSAFTNYRLVINCYVNTPVNGKFVFRTSAGDYTAAEYQRQRIYVYATNVIGSRTSNAANGEFNDIGGVPAGHTIDIFNPNIADYTTWVAHGLYAAVASQPELNMTVGTLANSQLVTGIKFNQAANITGTIRIYGYNNG